MIFYIFSKDRPAQLSLLLESMERFVKGEYQIVVQYCATSAGFYSGYKKVIKQYKSKVHFHDEIDTGFEAQLTSSLTKYSKVGGKCISFLVDDIVFLEHVNINLCVKYVGKSDIFSLRLGLTLSKSNIVNRLQPLPIDLKICDDNSTFTWDWVSNSMDWGYPSSLDGNIFLFESFLLMIDSLQFHSPNTLENSIVKYFKNTKKLKGYCFKTSKLVNLPFNRVQNDVANFSFNISPVEINKKFLSGISIDIDAYVGRRITSVHESWELIFCE